MKLRPQDYYILYVTIGLIILSIMWGIDSTFDHILEPYLREVAPAFIIACIAVGSHKSMQMRLKEVQNELEELKKKIPSSN